MNSFFAIASNSFIISNLIKSNKLIDMYIKILLK